MEAWAKINPKLAALVIYTQAVKFQSLELSAREPCCTLSSVMEKKLLRIINKQAARLVQHCTRFIMRVYPQGTRINSTNYDPQVRLDFFFLTMNAIPFCANLRQYGFLIHPVCRPGPHSHPDI